MRYVVMSKLFVIPAIHFMGYILKKKTTYMLKSKTNPGKKSEVSIRNIHSSTQKDFQNVLTTNIDYPYCHACTKLTQERNQAIRKLHSLTQKNFQNVITPNINDHYCHVCTKVLTNELVIFARTDSRPSISKTINSTTLNLQDTHFNNSCRFIFSSWPLNLKIYIIIQILRSCAKTRRKTNQIRKTN